MFTQAQITDEVRTIEESQHQLDSDLLLQVRCACILLYDSPHSGLSIIHEAILKQNTCHYFLIGN